MDADIALTKSNICRRSPGLVGPLPTRGTLDVRRRQGLQRDIAFQAGASRRPGRFQASASMRPERDITHGKQAGRNVGTHTRENRQGKTWELTRGETDRAKRGNSHAGKQTGRNVGTHTRGNRQGETWELAHGGKI